MTIKTTRNKRAEFLGKSGGKKLYGLDHKKHGIGGVVTGYPKKRKEDKLATHLEGYAVVFFPQYKLNFRASIWDQNILETLSKTPETAIVKFCDRIGGKKTLKQKWKQYSEAGHRVRKVKIIDMGKA